MALKDRCINPSTKAPYILSATAGRNVSTEKVKVDYSHCFVLTFQNNGDLQYYVDKDPAHLGFVDTIGSGGVVKVGVVDFEEGVL